jgi:hypothetical protein
MAAIWKGEFSASTLNFLKSLAMKNILINFQRKPSGKDSMGRTMWSRKIYLSEVKQEHKDYDKVLSQINEIQKKH